MSPNSKLILSTIAGLNLLAFLVIWALEANNPLTLASMSLGDQAVNAWFHATVPRSSGFNSLDMSSITDASSLFTIILMFIGGGSSALLAALKLAHLLSWF